jgi:hypothetical protein
MGNEEKDVEYWYCAIGGTGGFEYLQPSVTRQVYPPCDFMFEHFILSQDKKNEQGSLQEVQE